MSHPWTASNKSLSKARLFLRSGAPRYAPHHHHPTIITDTATSIHQSNAMIVTRAIRSSPPPYGRHVQSRALHYLSSPAKESLWLSQNGKHARAGAMGTANMSPRVQLVAAEEGLLTWKDAASPKLTGASPHKSRSQMPSKDTVGSRSNDTAPATLPSSQRQLRQQSKIYASKPPERDDTPGLIAFSCFLLLPLAFQLGRYVEGRESPWPAAEAALMRVLEPLEVVKSKVMGGVSGDAEDAAASLSSTSASTAPSTVGSRLSSLMWEK